jgi:hypothetical protein
MALYDSVRASLRASRLETEPGRPLAVPKSRKVIEGDRVSRGGIRREAAIRRNRTCHKCSSPHGERLYRLVGFGAADVKARTRLPFMLAKDSIGPTQGSSSHSGDFPAGGEPALCGRENPGKTEPGDSSAQELPGPKLKAEISVGRSRLCCALSQLPSCYPFRGPGDRLSATNGHELGRPGLSPACLTRVVRNVFDPIPCYLVDENSLVIKSSLKV